jgi:hypothetical protein
MIFVLLTPELLPFGQADRIGDLHEADLGATPRAVP